MKAGTPMEVTISGNTASNLIRGLLLEARLGDEAVGTFTLPPNEQLVQLLNCGKPGVSILSFLSIHRQSYKLVNANSRKLRFDIHFVEKRWRIANKTSTRIAPPDDYCNSNNTI